MSDQQQTATAPVVVTYKQVSETLRTLFGHICNPTDWKAPIDCYVPVDMAEAYRQSIKFMTATEPSMRRELHDGQYMIRLRSIGYRMGPAGP